MMPCMMHSQAHHGLLEKTARLDATLCFVNDADEAAAAVWSSGEVGGFEWCVRRAAVLFLFLYGSFFLFFFGCFFVCVF